MNSSFSSNCVPSLAASSVSSVSSSPQSSSRSIGAQSAASSASSMAEVMKQGLVSDRGFMSSSPCRGLERQIHTILNKHRPNYIQSVLDIQDNRLPDNLDLETKQRLLGVKAAKLSRPARILARLLAHSDHLEVTASIREEILAMSASSIPPPPTN